MEDNTHVPSEDADQELEAQMLTVVKKFIPVLRVAKNTSKVLSRLSSVGADTVSRQKIWDTTSKKLRETFIHYSLVSSVHI